LALVQEDAMAVTESKYTQQITNFSAVRHDQQCAYGEKRECYRKDDATQPRFMTCTVRAGWAFAWKVYMFIVLTWATSLLVRCERTIHVHCTRCRLTGDGRHDGGWQRLVAARKFTVCNALRQNNFLISEFGYLFSNSPVWRQGVVDAHAVV